MKLGLKLWSSNTEFYLPEAKRLHREGVFHYLELFAVPGTIDTLAEWKAFDVPYVIHSPHFAAGFNLAKPSMREANLEMYAQTRKFADALGASRIIFHGGINGSADELIRQLSALKEPRALLENKPMLPLPRICPDGECRGFAPGEVARVMRETGCGFCLDFGHAVAAASPQGKDPYSYISEFLALRPDMYHLSDVEDIKSPWDSHEHLGAGMLDIKRLLGQIPEGSMISIETKKDFKDSLEDFRKDAQWLRNLK